MQPRYDKESGALVFPRDPMTKKLLALETRVETLERELQRLLVLLVDQESQNSEV